MANNLGMTITGGAHTTAQTNGGVPHDTFGNRLMLARAHAGHLSIREAADLCQLGRGAWTNWERGARPIDRDEVAEIVSEKLGVDYEWLRYGGPLAIPVRRVGTTRRRNGVTLRYREAVRTSTGARTNGLRSSANLTETHHLTGAAHRPPGRVDDTAPPTALRRPAVRAQRHAA